MVNSKKKPVIEALSFFSGEFLLNGYLHLPPVPHPPFVIGCHGLYSDKNSPKQIELARQCNQHNIAYFRFDHRGCGESKAPFETSTSLEARCLDLKSAVQMLHARGDLGDQMGLFGSSMGGAVCLNAAGWLQADAVISWAAPIRSRDLVEKHASDSASSDIPFKNNPFDLSNQLAGIRNTLIFHGDADETVPPSHAAEIYRLVAEPKKLVIFPHSDHRMSRPADQQVFVQEASMWFRTFLKSEIN